VKEWIKHMGLVMRLYGWLSLMNMQYNSGIYERWGISWKAELLSDDKEHSDPSSHSAFLGMLVYFLIHRI
jgi:hypothetical protein